MPRPTLHRTPRPRPRPRAGLRRTGIGTRIAALTTTTALAAAMSIAAQGSAHAASASLIRVDQIGYLPTDAKTAYLMAGAAVSGARFAVVNSAGRTVLSGSVGATSRGKWNSAYPDVYPITFTGLTKPGTYHLTVSGGTEATSPTFTITTAAAMYDKLVADGVSFYQVQRDGANIVAGPLHRKPSHLDDAKASVYKWPDFESGGSDTITDQDLTRTGATRDVEGGWFDAGDFLKFTHTAAYGDALLFASQRALGASAPASLATEAHYGESWLNEMWDQSTKTLYLQVGIGSGNSAGTFTGDHDLWRLPQADDSDKSAADRYSAARRPVFAAAPAGARISPNLAGRVSAAFALAAQADAKANPARAAAEYKAATSLYAQADTTNPPNPLVTALPNAYYPESTWHDDMEFGGAEIALAAQKLGHNAALFIADAATWAKDYIASDTGDTFNLYDTSALAHADLIKAMADAGNPTGTGLPVTEAALAADLKRQLQDAANKAKADIFHAGGNYDDFDVDSHTAGFLTTEALYQQATGDTGFTAFATEQRDWLFGANPWGSSFMVGEGTTYPHCMQHQVANLSGSTTGTSPIDVGAVVNGPNDQSQFDSGLGDLQDGMKACPASGDPFSAFTGHGSRYVDDVRSWQSSEPALDMTGSALFGAAMQESLAK
jgi:endoglucanase